MILKNAVYTGEDNEKFKKYYRYDIYLTINDIPIVRTARGLVVYDNLIEFLMNWRVQGFNTICEKFNREMDSVELTKNIQRYMEQQNELRNSGKIE